MKVHMQESTGVEWAKCIIYMPPKSRLELAMRCYVQTPILFCRGRFFRPAIRRLLLWPPSQDIGSDLP